MLWRVAARGEWSLLELGRGDQRRRAPAADGGLHREEEDGKGEGQRDGDEGYPIHARKPSAGELREQLRGEEGAGGRGRVLDRGLDGHEPRPLAAARHLAGERVVRDVAE